MNKSVFVGLAMLVAACASFRPAPAGAVLLGFDPISPFVVSAGDAISVDVVVSDLAGAIVTAFDLDVTYDAAVLSADGVTFGTTLGNPFFFEALASFDLGTAGLVDFKEVSLLSDAQLASAQSGLASIALASLQFTALAGGQTSLAFQFGPGQDIKGAANAVIFPIAVPEPATWTMVLLGLLALASFGRRSRA